MLKNFVKNVNDSKYWLWNMLYTKLIDVAFLISSKQHILLNTKRTGVL